jgi:hypothetical protein
MSNDWVKDIHDMHAHYGMHEKFAEFDEEKKILFLSFRANFLQEELDELKKSTLASYVRKASDSMGNAAHSLGKKSERSDEVDRMTNRHMPDKYNVRDNMKKALDADEKSQRKDREVIGKRMYGIRQATSRLSKD